TVADGGIGKSTLALTEAIAIAIGRPLLGIAPNKELFDDGGIRERRGVLYYNAEESRAEIQRRVLAICQHFEIDLSELNKPMSQNPWRSASELTIISGYDFPFVLGRPGADGGVTFSKDLDYLECFEGDVIILDPFVSLHQCPESNNGMID